MNDKIRERNTQESPFGLRSTKGRWMLFDFFFLKIKELEDHPVSIFPIFLKPLETAMLLQSQLISWEVPAFPHPSSKG